MITLRCHKNKMRKKKIGQSLVWRARKQSIPKHPPYSLQKPGNTAAQHRSTGMYLDFKSNPPVLSTNMNKDKYLKLQVRYLQCKSPIISNTNPQNSLKSFHSITCFLYANLATTHCRLAHISSLSLMFLSLILSYSHCGGMGRGGRGSSREG